MDSFRSNQTQDYPIRFEEFPRGYIRYLYARSSDSRSSGTEGQDYVAWRYTPHALGFVVCDGVGSSFCGNIAAEYLGNQLIKFLFDVGPTLEEMNSNLALAEKTMGYLSEWQEGGYRKAESVKLPAGLPPLQLQALQQQRQEHGSETVFACGRLSFGERSGKLVLIWMGDTEVWLIDREGQRIDIGGLWRNADRWSTKYGIRKRGTRVHAWIGDLEEHRIDRILAFSDGLSTVADEVHTLQDGELQTIVGKQLMSPSSDDISFFDVRLKRPAPPQALEAPEDLRGTSENEIAWADVKGAKGYELEEAGNGVFARSRTDETRSAEWPLERSKLSPKPIYRYYRVRAMARNQPGQWSQTLCLRPAPLSTPAEPQIQDAPDDPSTYTVSWSAVPGAQYYVLVEQTGPQCECEIYLGSGREHTLTGQQPGKYRYRVRACGPAGQSDLSESCEKEVPDSTVEPGPDSAPKNGSPKVEIRITPKDLNAQSPGETTLGRPTLEDMEPVEVGKPYTVQWSSVPGATSYKLQVADNRLLAEGEQFNDVYEGSNLHRREEGKSKAEDYYYRVRAMCDGQTGDWSDRKAITVKLSLKPAAPRLYPIENPSGNASYVVQWTSVPDADKYKLEETRKVRGIVGPRYSTRDYPVGEARRMEISQREPGIYYYRVMACSKYGCSDYSDSTKTEVRKTSSAERTESPHPPIITGITQRVVRRDLISVRLTWQPVTGAKKYRVWRDPPGNDHPAFASDSFYEDSLGSGEYYYWVLSIGHSGTESAWSNPMQVIVKHEVLHGLKISYRLIRQK